MIHLGAMNGVTVDVAARRAVSCGGATWADVDAATQQHGLATPGGFISHTCVAGKRPVTAVMDFATRSV